MDGEITDEFTSAPAWLAAVASRVEPSGWDQPGLGAWDVRSLLGHASRSLVTVEEYLAQPARQVEVPSALAYLAFASGADPGSIASRGAAAGVALGGDPAGAVTELARRTSEIVRATAPDARLTTIAGGMTLEAYLPTRTVELIVHGCDLAMAIGQEPDPPREAATSTARLLVEVQLATAGSAATCLALAGRPIPGGSMVIWPSA